LYIWAKHNWPVRENVWAKATPMYGLC